MASAALAATRAAGLKSNVVFVPRASASPGEVAAARETGAVSPLYTGSPAPMGLAYYGLSAGPGGSVVPTILNTTSLEANVNANATGIQAADLFQSSPDSYGIQLNAVVTNVTLFGTPGYSFWTQNVVEFYPQAGFLVLITNVWNFSGGPLSENVFYQHGPFGTQVGTEYYYAELVVPFPVAYPFNLTLFLNSTVAYGRNAVEFNVQLTSAAYPSEDFTAPYDYVVFNSTAGGPPITVPSNYTANGFSYNPIGLTDDFELIFGGPGGGSQSTLFAADATLGLGYWTGSGYASVPSAYSYGGETGETVTGANVAWSNDPSGSPYPGLADYGTMTTGPSVLTGLWNAGAPEGSYPVTLSVSPANAFNVITTSTGWPVNFTIAEPAVAPELYTNVVYLIPGNYTVLTELSDYSPVTTTLDVTGPTTLTVSLAHNPLAGIYTPLWAFSNSEIAAISSSGAGTPSSPYVIDNNQYAPIGSEFGLYNDYVFPVYPAVFFLGTTATTEFLHPPSFATLTNTFAFPGPYLPATNDLQYWFWDVANVAVVGASNISGWFGATAFYPVVFDTFSMIFYEGGHNLVARNVFASEGQGLLMFSGGTFFGPLNVGGGNNTVWGNEFFTVPTPASPLELLPGYYGLAMEIAESNDLIYNNYVDTPTTAWLLPLNLYSGAPEFFSDAFNIPKQSASIVHFASGFPFVPLVGSIIGTSYQGGNFWWDYGLAFNPYNGANNPYGVLPYDENAPTLLVYVYGPSYYYATYIYPGGDYVPLVPFTLYAVTVEEHGLPSGLTWGAEITQGSAILDFFETTASSYVIYLPSGAFDYSAIAPSGWTSPGPSSVPFVVPHHAATLVIPFRVAHGNLVLVFAETGLRHGTAWTVTIFGSSPTTDAFNATETSTGPYLVFSVSAGTYGFAVTPVPGYSVSPNSGTLAVTGSTAVHLRFGLYTYAVTFTESGLSAGQFWKVTIDGMTVGTTGSSITFQIPNGTYGFSVQGPVGYSAAPSHGSLTVNGGAVSESVTFARR